MVGVSSSRVLDPRALPHERAGGLDADRHLGEDRSDGLVVDDRCTHRLFMVVREYRSDQRAREEAGDGRGGDLPIDPGRT